jgi:4-hydroxybenzoate polyprenyltransferase
MKIFKALPAFARDIKLTHSVFALPFAASGLLLSHPRSLSFGLLLKLLVCMVSARSFAMGMNRYLDRNMDKKNPRTSGREIPRGALTPMGSLTWSLLFAGVFTVSAFQINERTGILAVPLLLVLLGYSYTKKLGWFCHFYLGACLGLAPIACALALGEVTGSVILLGLGVLFWTAGFDMIYSTQDQEFDRSHGFYSIPARFGIPTAVRVSRVCFGVMVVLLLLLGEGEGLGWIYYGGVLCVAACLFYEHWLVRGLLSQSRPVAIEQAFFHMNALVSLIFYGALQLGMGFSL